MKYNLFFAVYWMLSLGIYPNESFEFWNSEIYDPFVNAKIPTTDREEYSNGRTDTNGQRADRCTCSLLVWSYKQKSPSSYSSTALLVCRSEYTLCRIGAVVARIIQLFVDHIQQRLAQIISKITLDVPDNVSVEIVGLSVLHFITDRLFIIEGDQSRSIRERSHFRMRFLVPLQHHLSELFLNCPIFWRSWVCTVHSGPVRLIFSTESLVESSGISKGTAIKRQSDIVFTAGTAL